MSTSPALNAVHHGLYTHNLVLTETDRDAYEKASKTLVVRYNPQTDEELELVQTLHETAWRLDRAIVNERNLHILTEQQQLTNIDALFGELDEPIRRALAQAAGLQANMRIFDQLSRHISRLHRLIDQTRRTLEFRITQRRQAEQLPVRDQAKVTEQSQPKSASAAQMPNFTGSLKEFKRKQWLRQQDKLNDPQSAA